MYTSIIVDDEPLAHKIIEEYVKSNESIQIIGNFYNAMDAHDYLLAHEVDLLFLDIQMPDLDGVSFLKTLKHKPITIMTTAYRDFALEGFELGVLDYLVKPISRHRFDVAFERAIEFLHLSKQKNKLIASDEIEPQKLTIKSGTKYISVPLDSITHIQGLKDYVIFYADKNKYVTLGYIKKIESSLPTGQFIRAHKSFLVARKKINLINRGKIILDGFEIPIGRIYKHQIMNLLEKNS